MASAADNEDLTHCIVCFEEYDREAHVPRLLSCTHTFCQLCLSDLIQSSAKTTFSCPECRIDHDITAKGTKEYPQNKYILSHLEKLEKDRMTEAYCENHKRPLALFCTDPGCRKSLCAMCYIEGHNNHPVTDFVQEAHKCKQQVTTEIEARLRVLEKHKELLKSAQIAVDETTEDSLEEMKKREKCLINQIQSEFQVLSIILTSYREKEYQKFKEQLEALDEKCSQLESILNAVNTSSNASIMEHHQAHLETGQNVVAGIVTLGDQSRDFVKRVYNQACYETNKVDDMIKQLVGSVINKTESVTFPGLTRVAQNCDDATKGQANTPKYKSTDFEADCGAEKKPAKRSSFIFEFAKLARKFKSNYSVINAVHCTRNGNMFLSGEDSEGNKWLLHIDQTGQILWTKRLESELAGIDTIELACTPCLVFAHSDGCRIDFYDMKMKDQILYSLDLSGHSPGNIASLGHILSFVDLTTSPYSLQFIDCSCFPPKLQDKSESLALSDDLIADVCLMHKGSSLRAVVSTDKSLRAYDVTSGSIAWEISGIIETGKEPFYPWGICNDDKGNIFVADRSNDCVVLVVGDNSAKTILDNVPYVQELAWDPQHDRLIVQHEDNETESGESQMQISTFQVSYKAASSNLSKLMGSLFGDSVGEWVEGNIDTVKYGFSDLGKA